MNIASAKSDCRGACTELCCRCCGVCDAIAFVVCENELSSESVKSDVSDVNCVIHQN